MAGQVTDKQGSILNGKGYEIIFEQSGVRDFVVDEEGNIYVSNPDESLVSRLWQHADGEKVMT